MTPKRTFCNNILVVDNTLMRDVEYLGQFDRKVAEIMVK